MCMGDSPRLQSARGRASRGRRYVTDILERVAAANYLFREADSAFGDFV